MSSERIEPFSIRMRGSDAIAAYSQDTKSSDPMYCNHLGNEKCNGFSCQKIEFVTMDEDTQKVYYREVCWLAEDRNFLPIRYESYESWTKDKYLTCGEVKKFEEVALGIWIPTLCEEVHYNSLELRFEGRQEIGWTLKTSVSDARLISEADPKVFSEVKFPHLAVMYELDAEGKILRDWQEGVVPVAAPKRIGTLPLIFMLAGSLVLAILATVVLRRRANLTKSTTDTGDAHR